MHRRQFLKTAAAGVAVLPFASSLFVSPAFGQSVPAPLPSATAGEKWRTFEITTQVTVDFPKGVTRVWIPLPLGEDTDYQRTVSTTSSAPGAKIRTEIDARYKTGMLVVEWPEAAGTTPSLELVSRVETRNRHVDLKAPVAPVALGVTGKAPIEKAADLTLWLQATELLPTDGIVQQKALEITGKLPKNSGSIVRARAIYDWVVENTFRDPKTRGCGIGDVKYMLETGNLGGKCADINAVFVALARSSGIPARDVYGIRTAASARGYKSIGKAGDITKGQHCRAEFYADGYGWIPVDPADVRKVMLEEEKGGLPLTDPKVVAIREYLFGHWEMNWVAFNRGHDLALPGSALGAQATTGFLMYPNGETADGRLDQLDPDNFKYRIVSREIVS